MAAATAAIRRVDIDLCQCAHDDEAEDDESNAREQCIAKRSRLEQHADVVRPDEKQPECYEYRQTAQDIRAHALRGGQRLDVALDAQSLTDRLGDRIEYLREASADLMLNVDRRDDELQVVRWVPRRQSLERIFLRRAETDLAAHEEKG